MIFGFMRSGDKGTSAKRVEQVGQRNASQRFADDAGAPSEGGVASSAVMQEEEDPAESGPVLGAEAAQVTSDASTATQAKLEERLDYSLHPHDGTAPAVRSKTEH
ncbi:unnamed protein product [Arctogadus glacialis]